jgi:hypothetical protein
MIARLALLLALAAPAASALSLADCAFLTGTWQSEQGGDMHEEHWQPPQGDSMIGSYRIVKAGRTVFYELVALEQTEGEVRLLLRHFGRGLAPKEREDEHIAFKLVRAGPAELEFEGTHRETARIRYQVAEGALVVTLFSKDGKALQTYRMKRAS